LKISNVGDSRAYLCRNGETRMITIDHSHLDSGRLTQWLGASGISPSAAELELQHGDRLLLCTDGVYRPLGDRMLQALISACGEDAEEAVGMILDKTEALGAEDDHSAIYLYCRGS